MNVGQIFTEVRKRGLTDSVDYPDVDLMMLLNSRIRDLHGLSRWGFLRRERDFSSVIGQFAYRLPFEDLRDIEYIRRPAEPRQRLTRIDTQVYFSENPDAGSGSSGSPDSYVDLGDSAVTSQPSAAGQVLEVVSDSASDGSAIQVRVVGMVGGQEKTVQVNLNGTTAVSLVSSFTEVLAFSTSAVTVGTVTLRVVSAGATLATKAPGLTSTRFQKVGLDPLPASVETFSVGYFRRMIDVVSVNDVPPVPEERHNLLVYGVLADLLAFEDDDIGYAKFEKKWAVGLSLMLMDDKNPQDKRSQFRVANSLARSRMRRRGQSFVNPGVDTGV